MVSDGPRNWLARSIFAMSGRLNRALRRFLMILEIAAAAAMQATVSDSWTMGGGQSWINPSRGAYCQPYKKSCIDPTIRETRSSRKFAKRDIARIEARAREGDVQAMRALGLAQLKGKDRSAGLGWIYEAAIRGDPVSMYVLGRAFEEGIGLQPDPHLAQFWLGRAAAHGLNKQP